MDHPQADVLWACHAVLPLRRWGSASAKEAYCDWRYRDSHYGVYSQIFSDPYHGHQCSRRARFRPVHQRHKRHPSALRQQFLSSFACHGVQLSRRPGSHHHRHGDWLFNHVTQDWFSIRGTVSTTVLLTWPSRTWLNFDQVVGTNIVLKEEHFNQKTIGNIYKHFKAKVCVWVCVYCFPVVVSKLWNGASF